MCTDGELIQRTGEGDEAAYTKLYERHARPVYGLALRRLGDKGQAEDAVQDTFASIWRSAKTYRPERGPGTPWLYRVARNAIIDRGRNRSRDDLRAEVPEEPSLDGTPGDQAEAGWVSWQVHRAVESLPAQERQVIALAYWSNLSQSEVAERLGIPLGTVKTRTRSGLQHLAEILEGELK